MAFYDRERKGHDMKYSPSYRICGDELQRKRADTDVLTEDWPELSIIQAGGIKRNVLSPLKAKGFCSRVYDSNAVQKPDHLFCSGGAR